MTQDEIIEMAEQAGWSGIYSQWVSPTERTHLTVPVTMEQLEAFVKLVAAKEREACANINREKALSLEKEAQAAEEEDDMDGVILLRSSAWLLSVCEGEIRARGEALQKQIIYLWLNGALDIWKKQK